MFGPSLKSVPGCLVSIVPMLIGVPVALTPGFGPHDEVLVEAVLALVVPLVLELDAPLAALLDVVELLLLLPHPASTSTAPTSTASAQVQRRRSASWYFLTSTPPRNDLVDPPLWRGADLIPDSGCMQRTPNATERIDCRGSAGRVLHTAILGAILSRRHGQSRQPDADDARAPRPARAAPERRVQARRPHVRAAVGRAARGVAHPAAAPPLVARSTAGAGASGPGARGG